MVASVPDTSKRLKPRHLRFAQARAAGATQSRAYQLAVQHDVSLETAKVMGCQWDNRPDIRAKVRELQDLADSAVSLRMSERRKLLAETAREQPNRPPSHSERIAALKLDAELSGDLKDQTAISINIASVLASLGPATTPPPSMIYASQGPGGAPILDAEVTTMGGNQQKAVEAGSFTNGDELQTPLSENEKNPDFGIFTNELGEVEE